MPSAACQSRCCPQGLLQVEEMADFPRLPVGRPSRHSWPGTPARPPPPRSPARPVPRAPPRCNPLTRGESVFPAGHPVGTASHGVRWALGPVPATALQATPPASPSVWGCALLSARPRLAGRTGSSACGRGAVSAGRRRSSGGLGVVVSHVRASARVRPWAVASQVTEEAGTQVVGPPGRLGRTGRVA